MNIQAKIKVEEPFYYVTTLDGKKLGRISEEAKKLVKDGDIITTDFWGLHGKNNRNKYLENCDYENAYLSCKQYEYEPEYATVYNKKELKHLKECRLCDVCANSNTKARLYFTRCPTCGNNH